MRKASGRESQPFRESLKVKSNTKWYLLKPASSDDEPKADPAVRVPLDTERALRTEAQELMDKDCGVYRDLQGRSSRRSDFGWIRAVLSKGTVVDKLSAHTILLQDSPVHNVNSLTALLQMVDSKGKRESLMAVDNLRDLFLGDLLPKEKLKPFREQIRQLKEGDPRKREIQLILYLFEDQVRQMYRQFVESIEKTSHDTLQTTKNKAINTMFELLANSPEQEQFLLEKLVNKLGDPLPRIASHVSHLLKKLINENHPAMKDIVVKEVERVLYRPNITEKAQYYCLCFLQEIMFKPKDNLLASKLIDIYFGFFKACIKKGDVNNKTMSALLTGVSRALPFSSLGSDMLSKQMETLYRIVYYVNTNIAIQVMTLVFNALDVQKEGSLTDRFYCVLYRLLLDSQLENCSRVAMFLNLVFRSMKRDPSKRRVLAFIKRLLEVAQSSSSAFASSLLILVSEVLKQRPNIASAFYAGKEIEEKKKKGKVEGEEEEEKKKEEEEEEEEQEEDDAEDGEEDDNPRKGEKEEGKDPEKSWIPVRNPLNCKSSDTCFWDVSLISKHYHPSIALFSKNVSEKNFIRYDGDPLVDFTLKHFLDRFVYRNPKSVDNQDKLVARQNTVFGRLKGLKKDIPVNSTEFVNQPVGKVHLEERFIYQYLQDKERVKKVGDEDMESVASDEFEQLLDRYEHDFGGKDFAADFKMSQKRKPMEDMDEDEDDEDSFDDMNEGDSDGEDLDLEEDDDYKNAFRGVEDELEDALDDAEDIPSKHIRKGRNKSTSSLFASADKFAELLEANSEDEMSSEDGDGDGVRVEGDFGGERKECKKKTTKIRSNGKDQGKWRRPPGNLSQRKRFKKKT